jgi:hypothetical protein
MAGDTAGMTARGYPSTVPVEHCYAMAPRERERFLAAADAGG